VSVAAGTGYGGAWNQLVVWTRSTDVFVSRTHSDYLTRNLAAVLAEIRAAVGVLAPQDSAALPENDSFARKPGADG
jgi:hypothetical protein